MNFLQLRACMSMGASLMANAMQTYGGIILSSSSFKILWCVLLKFPQKIISLTGSPSQLNSNSQCVSIEVNHGELENMESKACTCRCVLFGELCTCSLWGPSDHDALPDCMYPQLLLAHIKLYISILIFELDLCTCIICKRLNRMNLTKNNNHIYGVYDHKVW